MTNRLPYQFDYDVRDVYARSAGYGNNHPDYVSNLEGVERPYGHGRGWDSFITKIFNRPPQPNENPHPKHEDIRSQRRFENARLIVPLEYLAEVEIPEVTPEDELKVKERTILRYRQGITPGPIIVGLPASGPPIVARQFMPILAAARELELFEISVRVRWM